MQDEAVKDIIETIKTKITPKNFYATFLQRVIAFGIDYFLLTLCTWVLIAFKSNLFYQQGEALWWIGYTTAGVYFTWGYSSFGQGQTIGKKIMKISLINYKGGYLDITSSILRYFVISLILFYPQILATFFEASSYNLIFQIFCFIVILGIFLGLTLFSALGSKKRALHDYISGSYVAKNNLLAVLEGKEIKNLTSEKSNNKLAWFLFSATMLIFCMIFATTVRFAGIDKIPYNEFYTVKLVLEQDMDFKNIQIVPDFYVKDGGIKKNLFIGAFIEKKDFDDNKKIKELKDKIKDICYRNIKSIHDYKKITIYFRTGIDLGLASLKEFRIEKIITKRENKK